MEGYKPIPVSDAINELIDMVEKANAEPICTNKNQSIRDHRCFTLVVVVRLPGPTIDRSCGGGWVTGVPSSAGAAGWWGPRLLAAWNLVRV